LAERHRGQAFMGPQYLPDMTTKSVFRFASEPSTPQRFELRLGFSEGV